jgi:K(+)-stimulated pyrophosphate-energized sodium pump
MCDDNKCTPEQKEMCLSHYDKDGKFITPKGKACCAKKSMKMSMDKEIRIEKSNINGKVTATVTTTVDGMEVVKQFEGTDAEVDAQIDALK